MTKCFLGQFEELVLLAILRLENNAYGLTIRQTLEAATGRAASIGAVYATLDRLERKGLVNSWQGEATPERGGRAKRYFKISGAGIRALADMNLARRKIADGLEPGWNSEAV